MEGTYNVPMKGDPVKTEAYAERVSRMLEHSGNRTDFAGVVEENSVYVEGRGPCDWYDMAANAIISSVRETRPWLLDRAVNSYRRGLEQVIGLHPAENGSLKKTPADLHREFVEYFRGAFAQYVHTIR